MIFNRKPTKKTVTIFAATAVLFIVFAAKTPAADFNTTPADALTAVPSGDQMILQLPDPVDAFLAQSAFIGNSVGEGLTMYNNANKKVPLGNAVMLTRVSYSFYADANSMSKFLPKLNGVAMRAKDAIKQSGARYAFICMGTNDLVGSSTPESAFAKYQQYLAGIMAENPTVVVFVESCTPTRPGSNVNNDKVTAFNAYAQAYCDSFPNMFYVDIATPLKGPDGYLSASLTSDGSVHLTNKAYAIWANTIRAYITNLMSARVTALKEQHEAEYETAQANYSAAMKNMEEKQKEASQARAVARQKEKELAAAKLREELLNVPDAVTLMRNFAQSSSDETPSLSSASVASMSSFFADATFKSSL